MSFGKRKEMHDKVLKKIMPSAFQEIGMVFKERGYEVSMSKDKLLITNLEDITAQSVRFTPDGIAIGSGSYLVELKTRLPEQKSPNYDFEMSPWEKGMTAHQQGSLVAYIFWPDMRVCWITDSKPDWIGVPKWRWNVQDYLRIKHRYENLCPVQHIDVEEGSGTVFGVIMYTRIKAMPTFKQFWLEVQGKWQTPKQLKLM
jgi:hypothetical protein